MGKCLIFCAAGFDGMLRDPQPSDLIIAADGGLRHLIHKQHPPHVILGDFDSLGYVPAGATVYPVEKDDTDSMLVVRLGLERGYKEFILYGALDGPRLDHTVANFQTLQFLADHGAFGYLVGADTLVTVVKNGALHFPRDAEGILSVFCLGAPARGVTLQGVQYELENGTLSAGFPLGVSNHFVGRDATVRVDDGSLLVLWHRKNGLPARD